MQTMLDLPGDLIDELRLRASNSGVDVNHAATGFLRLGLALSPSPVEASYSRPRLDRDAVTGFPILVCDDTAAACQMSVDRLIALEEATQTQQDLERLGVPHR